MSIQLKTIGILVADMQKTLAFYRALGLAIPEADTTEDNLDVELDNGLTLGFLTLEMARRADPNFVEPVGQSLNLQFMSKSPAEVDATYNRLMQAGYQSHAAPWDAFWGQRFARVLDPDGRVVNVYAMLS